MISHLYQFSAAAVARLLALPLLLLALFAGAMHFGARFNVLPAPRPILDVDRTILLHQAEASHSPSEADIILAGDSSCLMDISAAELDRLLGGDHRVLNLATLSYLDLSDNASLLREYFAGNPGRVKTVVLLMHPESLRLRSRNPYFREVLQSFFARTDYCSAADSRVLCALGVHIAKGRIVSRLLPVPLPGAWGRLYGFNRDLWEHMSSNFGSATDPHNFDPRQAEGNPEYRLTESLKETSAAFRAAIPPGVRLLVGITPSPRGFALANHEATCRRMLEQWTKWLNASAGLDLPCIMDDRFFASTTHLNAQGAQIFTAELARQLPR